MRRYHSLKALYFLRPSEVVDVKVYKNMGLQRLCYSVFKNNNKEHVFEIS
jgi:hypothetical protein